MKAQFVFEAVNTMDKYYAPPELLDHVFEMVRQYIPLDKLTDIVEPAAGDLAFGPYLDKLSHELNIPVHYYDLDPDDPKIKKQDFLHNNPMTYKRGRLIITGPPYGTGSKLWLAFAKKASELGDYVVFISPVYFYNVKHPVPTLQLIKSDQLGKITFTGAKDRGGLSQKVKTCVNVYQSISPRNSYDTTDARIDKDFSIKEYHLSRMIDEHWQYYIAAYGYAVGNVSKEPQFEVSLGVNLLDEKLRPKFEKFLSTFRDKHYEEIKSRSTTTQYLSVKMFKEFIKVNIY
jgi:hypothetical protein